MTPTADLCPSCEALRRESESRREALVAKSAELVEEWKRAERAEAEVRGLAEAAREVLFTTREVGEPAPGWLDARGRLVAAVRGLAIPNRTTSLSETMAKAPADYLLDAVPT